MYIVDVFYTAFNAISPFVIDGYGAFKYLYAVGLACLDCYSAYLILVRRRPMTNSKRRWHDHALITPYRLRLVQTAAGIQFIHVLENAL